MKGTVKIRVRLSNDWRYFVRLFNEPGMYCRISDDFSPAPGALDAGAMEHAVGMELVKVEREYDGKHGVEWRPGGLFLLVQVGERCYDVHTMLTEECRGRLALEAGRQVMALAFGKLGAERLTGRCPGPNRAILKFAKRLGFVETGRTADWCVGGKVWESVYVAMNRGDWERNMKKG